MSIWVNTRGKATVGIGLCDRCHFKFPLGDLVPDSNTPGLRVCRNCCDQFDPYRLPARQPDDIALPFYRPQEPLVVPDEYVTASVLAASQDALIIHVTWTAAVSSDYLDPITVYWLYRSVNGAAYEVLATFDPSTLSYDDESTYDVSDVVAYYVVAHTRNFDARSNIASVTITGPAFRLKFTAGLAISDFAWGAGGIGFAPSSDGDGNIGAGAYVEGQAGNVNPSNLYGFVYAPQFGFSSLIFGANTPAQDVDNISDSLRVTLRSMDLTVLFQFDVTTSNVTGPAFWGSASVWGPMYSRDLSNDEVPFEDGTDYYLDVELIP